MDGGVFGNKRVFTCLVDPQIPIRGLGSVAAGALPVLSDLITDYTPAIIIMLHLAWDFRPTRRSEHTADGEKGKRDSGRAYLQLPEYLRLAAGLQVLQSLGPEAVFLVQGAMATGRADESMTTQEPEHESSLAV